MKISKALLITKLKATAVHLSLSIVVFVYLAYKIVYDWYPFPYFSIDGGWQGIRLIGAVDLVLGPLITFLIFNLQKRLRAIIFDLAVIAIIQIGALTYGIVTTYEQRPVAIVLIDEFVVSAIEEHYGGKLESLDQLKQYSNEHPPIVYASVPLDQASLQEIHRIKTDEGILEHAQLQLYRPAGELKQALQERQLLFASRLDSFQARGYFDEWLTEHGKTASEVLIAPFSGRYGRVWLVFDSQARYIGYFDSGNIGN